MKQHKHETRDGHASSWPSPSALDAIPTSESRDIPPFAITDSPIDAPPLIRALANPAAGALVTFEGWARNHNEGHDVQLLEYHAYTALCMKEAGRIIQEAAGKFGTLNALCRHRIGRLAIGDMAVWVGVVAPHRDEAFSACRYIIDEIKTRLPIWKREHYLPDSSGRSIEAQWVNCARCAGHHHERKE